MLKSIIVWWEKPHMPQNVSNWAPWCDPLTSCKQTVICFTLHSNHCNIWGWGGKWPRILCSNFHQYVESISPTLDAGLALILALGKGTLAITMQAEACKAFMQWVLSCCCFGNKLLDWAEISLPLSSTFLVKQFN